MMTDACARVEPIIDTFHFSLDDMPQAPLSNCKYSYSHYDEKELSQAIDIHDISIQKSRKLVLLSYFGTLLFLASSCYLLLAKEKLYCSSIWSIFSVIIFAKFFQYKPIKKESVVIIPEFGVQLESGNSLLEVLHWQKFYIYMLHVE